MKRKTLTISMAIFLASTISFQSCIGSFSLTNKVLGWNNNVSNKFINEVVFFAFWVLPVYEVTAIADLLVINSIEFWSGNNPLEANNRIIKTDHGSYLISSNSTGYKITSPDGNDLFFAYDEPTSTWSFSINDSEKTDFLKFIDESHIQVLNSNSEFVDVELTKEGVNDYVSSLGVPLMALSH